jgi:BirA family biotin operon repressor/biotin-[acetyl-CoA-carboxylase] ligase
MKTLFIGQSLIHLALVDSTNSYAAELLRKNKPTEGIVISTFNQTKGRGQRGNTWDSQPNNNVSLSVILYPSFLHPEKQFVLSKIISLAIHDLMTEFIYQLNKKEVIKIKWPNDIYINEKKIAGILIENTLGEGIVKSSIIGIGININQTIFNNGLNATSLALTTNKMYDLTVIIEKLCEHIEARYLQLKTNKKELIDSNYLTTLYQLNEWKKYSSLNKIFEGKIVGVSDSGKLKIETRDEAVKEFFIQEIQFLQ